MSNFGRLVVCKQAGWRVEWVGTRDKTLRQIYCPHTAHATQHTGYSTCHTAHGTQHTGMCTSAKNLITSSVYIYVQPKTVSRQIYNRQSLCVNQVYLASKLYRSVVSVRHWCRWVGTTPVGQIYCRHSHSLHGRQANIYGTKD